MFIDSPSAELRQGDVLAENVFPRWRFNDYRNAAGPDGGTTHMILHVLESGRPVPLVVCSHDCDLENPRNRPAWLIAPLLDPPRLSPEDAARLAGSAVRDEEERYDYIHLYPYLLPNGDLKVVEFSLLTPIGAPQKIRSILIDKKQFELTTVAREAFRTKLAAFVGRADD